MLHYNFPPYSVGEVKRMGGPSRRDIGHGGLSTRALEKIPKNLLIALFYKCLLTIDQLTIGPI